MRYGATEEEIAQFKEQKDSKQKQKKKVALKRVCYTFNTKRLYDTVVGAHNYSDECILSFSKGEMSIIQMDPANVAMFGVYCLYSGSKTEMKVLVNSTRLKMLLKDIFLKLKLEFVNISFTPAESDDTIIMKLSKEDTETYTTALVPEKEEKKIPELIFNSTYTVKKDKLKNSIVAISNLSTHISFISDHKTLTLSGKGDTNEMYIRDIAKAKISDSRYSLRKQIRSKYSSEYLVKAIKGKEALLKGEEIIVQFATDHPLRLEDDLGNWFLLAPRRDDDE